MPYIKQDRRTAIDGYLRMVAHEGDCFASDYPQDCGELNYALTMTCLNNREMRYNELDTALVKIVRDFLTETPSRPLRYQRINDAAGACECAALEMERRMPPYGTVYSATLRHVSIHAYRHIGVPYELKKIQENGDIADYWSQK